MRVPRGRVVAITIACFALVLQLVAAGASPVAHPPGAASVALASSSTAAQQETATIRRLISAANRHRLSQTSHLFTSSATLQTPRRRWRGRLAIEAWWRAEFVHHLHLSLKSTIQVNARLAQAIVWRTTRGGDCSMGCLEGVSWQFTGAAIQRMALRRLEAPPPPKPPVTVPPPPSSPPPPNVTPTIPT